MGCSSPARRGAFGSCAGARGPSRHRPDRRRAGNGIPQIDSRPSLTGSDADRLLALAREAKLTGPDADTWAERLWPERARIGEAADWLGANDRLDAAGGRTGATWRLWLLRGEIANGRSILGSTLDRAQTSAATGIRASALYGAGLLAFRAG